MAISVLQNNLTVMKLHFPKQAPKISYRDHKKFRSEIFRAELDNEFYELDA